MGARTREERREKGERRGGGAIQGKEAWGTWEVKVDAEVWTLCGISVVCELRWQSHGAELVQVVKDAQMSNM